MDENTRLVLQGGQPGSDALPDRVPHRPRAVVELGRRRRPEAAAGEGTALDVVEIALAEGAEPVAAGLAAEGGVDDLGDESLRCRVAARSIALMIVRCLFRTSDTVSWTAACSAVLRRKS